MITIRIEGERGEGKTTLALAIMRLLKDAKQTVKYQGHRAEKQVVTEAQKHSLAVLLRDFKEPKKFLVIDQDHPHSYLD